MRKTPSVGDHLRASMIRVFVTSAYRARNERQPSRLESAQRPSVAQKVSPRAREEQCPPRARLAEEDSRCWSADGRRCVASCSRMGALPRT